MVKRLIILSLVLTCLTVSGQSQDTSEQILRENISKFGQAEVVIPLPGPTAMQYLSRNVSINSVKDRSVFITISPKTVDWFIAQKFKYKILERPDNKGIISASSILEAMDWQTYPTYTQYISIMQGFAASYPSLCHLDTIGTSVNGRVVLVLKISDNVAADESEPEVFYTSSMHGDEIGGYVLMLRLAEYLLMNYNTIPRVKNMVDNLEIWINPLANPDGTYTTGNTITYPTRGNANYVDLNRNFPDPVFTSYTPEKENVDMMKFLRKRRFVISANFHAGEEVLNYPWDKWTRLHADDDWFYNICRVYADTVHVYSGPAYMYFMDNGVTNGNAWYYIPGGRQDYVTWELQGREVTIELDYSKETPAAQLENLWQYNYRSLLGYLENALYGVHGLVRDALTLNPVAAKVYISGHDKDSSHVYSDTLTGKFVRMLFPGTWALKFSAKGYKDTTVTNINVAARQSTDITVNLKPVTTTIDTTDPKYPELYPNPASNSVKCKLPDRISGPLNIRVYGQSGIKIYDYNTEALFGIPVILDVSRMAAGIYSVIFRNTISGITYRSRFVVLGHGN